MNIEQERAEFEAWYRLHHGSRDVYGRDASGEYADKQVQGAFNVWQACAALVDLADDIRAALAAQPAAATAGEAMNEEPVAWRWRWKDLPDAGWQLSSVGGWRDTEHIDAQPLYTHPTPPAQASGQASAASAEPVAWVAADTLNSPHPRCVSSLAYVSQIDRDRGREYVPLYAAAPVAAQAPTASAEQMPVRYYKEGGITYAVYGSSSINYVEKLRASLRNARQQAESADQVQELREALRRAHQTAMEQTLKARIPECAEFAGIAQDLDFVVAALRERIGEGGRNDLRQGDQP